MGPLWPVPWHLPRSNLLHAMMLLPHLYFPYTSPEIRRLLHHSYQVCHISDVADDTHSSRKQNSVLYCLYSTDDCISQSTSSKTNY